jgi:LysR family glycine cleavage system transcriptional activator
MGPAIDAADLRRFTLLHSRYRPDDWPDWTSHFNAGFSPAPGLVFGSSTLTYQAARDGLGVAMGQLRLLSTELGSGALVLPVNLRLERASSYFLVHSKQAVHDERITILRDWIINEARRESKNLPDWTGESSNRRNKKSESDHAL